MPVRKPVLTAVEISALLGAADAMFGYENLAAALVDSIGAERAQKLISTRKAVAWKKADTEALALELWPLVPGKTSAEKRKALVAAVRPCFGTKERYEEVMAYVLAKLEEALAGGKPAEPPAPSPEPPAPVAGVDLSRAEWWGKANEKAANWKVVGGIRISNVNGSTFDINQDREKLTGRNQVIAYFVFRDGRWLGGGFDGCGHEPFGMKRKTWGNAKTGVPGKHKGGAEQANRDKVKLRKGDAVVLCLLASGSKTRTPASQCFIWPSGKTVDPPTGGGTVDAPQDVPESAGESFTPPPRTGNPSYSGKGDIIKWLEIKGKNPSKSVSISCWVRFNGWVHKDVGANLINKGKVGPSWAFGLCVKPNEILYKATKGDVAASADIDTGRWYHVRVDATKSEAKFWLDGKPLKVARREVTSLFDSNDDPVRIGGHKMDWTPPSAWYNGSLDGEMSDWKVEVE